MSTKITVIVKKADPESGTPEDSRDLEVHEMDTVEYVRATHMQQRAASTLTGDDVRDNLRVFFYPVLSQSSSGNVPTEEEFLDMPVTQSNIWFLAVDHENPGVFPSESLGGPDKVEDIEKKEV